jgi:outer membrane protein
MKIIKLITISLIMTGMMIGSVNAAPLGYIDVQKVLSTYEKAKKYQEQLMLKEQSLRDEISAKQKQAEKAKSRGASDEDVKNMHNKIEKDFEPKRLDIMQFRQKTEHEIRSDISGAVATIAANMQIEMVVNKQALVYVTNGIDLTDKVIELLNKKK